MTSSFYYPWYPAVVSAAAPFSLTHSQGVSSTPSFLRCKAQSGCYVRLGLVLYSFLFVGVKWATLLLWGHHNFKPRCCSVRQPVINAMVCIRSNAEQCRLDQVAHSSIREKFLFLTFFFFFFYWEGKKKSQTGLYSHTLPPSKNGECKTHYIHQQEWKWTTLQNCQGDRRYVSTFRLCPLKTYRMEMVRKAVTDAGTCSRSHSAPTERAVWCLKGMACVIAYMWLTVESRHDVGACSDPTPSTFVCFGSFASDQWINPELSEAHSGSFEMDLGAGRFCLVSEHSINTCWFQNAQTSLRPMKRHRSSS